MPNKNSECAERHGDDCGKPTGDNQQWRDGAREAIQWLAPFYETKASKVYAEAEKWKEENEDLKRKLHELQQQLRDAHTARLRKWCGSP